MDGKYRILLLLGEGGMGSVYEAEDVASGRRVAVKVIHPDRKLNDDVVRRFRRETKAAMAVVSEHIARVLEGGTDPAIDAPYMVMEHLTGEDLQAASRRLGPLPPACALRIVGQACEGLRRAHDAGITHRDIKPANLFLARGGEDGKITVKILDFGIAKTKPRDLVGPETTGLTSTGAVLGSPFYMSPEQARGIKDIDHRTDLWSLGVVLYRLLTGREPHHEIDAFGDLIIALCSRSAEPVQQHAPWVPAEVAAIAHAALRLNPDDRYQSAAAMLEPIRALLPDGLELRAEMLVPLTEAERTVAVARQIDAVATQEERTIAVARQIDAVAAQKAWLAAAGLALATLLGVAGIYRATLSLAGHAAAPAASGSGSAPGPEVRRVWLRIAPPEAAVEVDGGRAEPKDGLVEITGALGSVHRVHLSWSGSEVTADVVVTEGGVMPGELTLVTTAPTPTGSTPEPAASAAAVTARTGANAARGASSGKGGGATAPPMTATPPSASAPSILGILETFE